MKPINKTATMRRHLSTALGVGLLGLMFLVSGCAGPMAFREGNSLVEQGKTEAGIKKLEQALATDPDNPEYRFAVRKAHEQAINSWLAEATAAQQRGEIALARDYYDRILKFDPKNAKAVSSLAEIRDNERYQKIVNEADAALKDNNREKAQAKLRLVLAENLTFPPAQNLQEKLDETPIPAVIASQDKLGAAYRKSVNIEFRDAQLRQIFDVLSRISDLNFIFDKDVNPDLKTTVYLRHSNVENAINLVLMTNQLEQRIVDNNTILIYPSTPAKLRDYQSLSVRSFLLSNSEAKTVGNTIKTVLKTKDLVIDDKQNMIIMHDTPDAIRIAEHLVAMHERPEAEVMLDVEILEINRSKLLELGVQLPNQLSLAPLSQTQGGPLTLSDLKNIDAARIGVTVGNVAINAHSTMGAANLLANPRILVRNREKAKIQVGQRVPNVTSTSTATGFVSENIQYIDVGLKLEVEPQIFPDNEVDIKLVLEVSSITNQIKTSAGSTAYEIGTRNANTVLRLRDGENQILAGLIDNQVTTAATKFPGLGDIPILGRLFGSQQDNTQKSEIILSITPHIVRSMKRQTLSVQEFETGTESSFRGRASSPISDSATHTNNTYGTGKAAAVTNNGANVLPSITPSNPSNGAPASALPNAAPVDPNQGTNTPPPVGGRYLTLSGPSTASINSLFTVAATLQSDQAITGVPLNLVFDPKLVQVTSIDEGSLLKQGGPSSFSSRVDHNTGNIYITNSTSYPEGAQGTGTVATIHFQALKAGTLNLQVNAPQLNGVGGVSVSLTAPAAPLSVSIK